MARLRVARSILRIKRVFISHVNGDPEVDRFARRLAETLKEAGYKVLADFVCLKPGQTWRPEIYGWLGLCHAAVILFSRGVLHNDKIWVARETAILHWRKALNPTFCLISVRFPGIDRQVLEKNERFRDLLLEEQQYVMINDDFEGCIEKIISTLQASTSSSYTLDTPYENLSNVLASKLGSLGTKAIIECAEKLELDLEPWQPEVKPARRLAMHLLCAEAEDLRVAISELADHTPKTRRSDLQDLVEILVANLVPAEVGHFIALEANRARRQNQRAIVLNNSSSKVAELYVLRASFRPKNAWQLLTVSTGVGSSIEEFLDEVEENLRTAFKIFHEPNPWLTDIRPIIKKMLERKANSKDLVFVMTNWGAGAEAKLYAIRSRWPMLIVMFSSPYGLPPKEECDPKIFGIIHPPLKKEQEDEILTMYYYLINYIQ